MINLIKLFTSLLIINVNALSVNVNPYFSQNQYYVGDEITLNIDYQFDEPSLIQVQIEPTNFTLYQTNKATSNWSTSGQFSVKGKATQLGEISAKITVVEVVNKNDQVLENKVFYAKGKVVERTSEKPQPKPEIKQEDVSVAPPIPVTKEEKPMIVPIIKEKTQIEKSLSSNTNLSDVTLKALNLYPNFSSSVTNYVVGLEKINDTITLEFKAEDSNSKITYENKPLKLGEKVEVVVTSESGSTKTYLFEIGLKNNQPFLIQNGKVITGVTNLPKFFINQELKLENKTIPTFFYNNAYVVEVWEENGESQRFYYKDNEFSPYLETQFDNKLVILQPFNPNRVKPKDFIVADFEFKGKNIKAFKHNKQDRWVIPFYQEDGKEILLESDKQGNLKPFHEQVKTNSNATALWISVGMVILSTVVITSFYVRKRKKMKTVSRET